MALISVDDSLCAGCGICVRVCPVGVLRMGERVPEAVMPEGCNSCGHCVAVCPYGALDNANAPLRGQTELRDYPVIGEDEAERFLRARRSVRCYKKEKVPREKLQRLVDVARCAPTASNKQGISYYVIEDTSILEKATAVVIEWMESQLGQPSVHWSFPYHVQAYRERGTDPVLRNAPHLIVAAAPADLKTGRENTIFSMAYLELFASAAGLGSCWAGLLEMCAFAREPKLLELFHIPEGRVFSGAVMVGYPRYTYRRLVNRNPSDVTWLG